MLPISVLAVYIRQVIQKFKIFFKMGIQVKQNMFLFLKRELKLSIDLF